MADEFPAADDIYVAPDNTVAPGEEVKEEA